MRSISSSSTIVYIRCCIRLLVELVNPDKGTGHSGLPPTLPAKAARVDTEKLGYLFAGRKKRAHVDEEEQVGADGRLLDRLRLLPRARVAVQQPALPHRVRLRQPILDHVHHHL